MLYTGVQIGVLYFILDFMLILYAMLYTGVQIGTLSRGLPLQLILLLPLLLLLTTTTTSAAAAATTTTTHYCCYRSVPSRVGARRSSPEPQGELTTFWRAAQP